MKVVILAGGLGSRIMEESQLKPKPMVEIGGKPILWHIMKIYSHYGLNEFIICLGYKGYVIKEYFSNYYCHMSDITFDIRSNSYKQHQNFAEPWKVTLINTGENTMTGGRIKRIKDYVKNDECFCLTYGDGVTDINIRELIQYHKSHKILATLTAVQPPARFGVLDLDANNTVKAFHEKPIEKDIFINGGFFVLSPKVIDYIKGDETPWEEEPLRRLAAENAIKAFKHYGFWHCMDTLRDKNLLENLWNQGKAPWKVWS